MQLRICPIGSFPLTRIRRIAQQRGVGSDGTVLDGDSWVVSSLIGLAVARDKTVSSSRFAAEMTNVNLVGYKWRDFRLTFSLHADLD